MILNNSLAAPNQHSAIYLRDYDTILNDGLNRDLSCVVGPAQICQSQQIPLNENWSYHLKLTAENSDFYEKPAEKANLTTDSTLLGYWSKPFKLTPNDVPIITYSLPIYDENGAFRGIVGVELLINQLKYFLPGQDLLGRDSISFLVGYKGPDMEQLTPMIMNGAIQERLLQMDAPLDLASKNKAYNIYTIENHTTTEDIYAGLQKIDVYNVNTPFEQEEWYLIGLTSENKLLGFVRKIQNILFLSFIGSILIGGISSYFASRIFTKPITQLAHQVSESNIKQEYELKRTGLTEIDHLSSVIEQSNKALLDSTLKLSQIINLVDVPIGAFEYKEQEQHVFATEQLKQVLLFEDEELDMLYGQKEQFINRLHQLMQHAEPDEENIYKIGELPEKWVRINMTVDEKRTLGIVIDVTREMLDKIQIKLDRDHDHLTNIYNRGAYKRNVTRLLEQGDLHVSACLMFDLDFLKYVNDNFGHKCGDMYITKTAECLNIFSEYGGIIGRISGDEFAVFLYNFDSPDDIRKLISKFYDKLAENPIQFPTEKRQIMISGGLYWLDGSSSYSYDDIMQKADATLYLAKNTKKGYLLEDVPQQV